MIIFGCAVLGGRMEFDMSKIGIMGGTFDPIHNGHLAIAEKAAQQLGLDKVFFVTSGNPPHKKGKKILDAKVRHKMVCMAIKNYSKFEPCDFEVNREAYSYTADTLQYFKKNYRKAELYLIIGSDSLHDLPTWNRPRKICEMCTLAVYDRNGYDTAEDTANMKKEYYCKIERIESGIIDISSSQIRHMIEKRKDVTGLMPRSVLDFINRNGLYTSDFGTLESKIKRRLKPNRFVHSVNVAKKAVELAERYGENTKKAYIAGMVHDCAKNIPAEKARQKCIDYDVELDEGEISNPGLIHAKLGERIAHIEFGICDKDILSAIKWHTLGHPDMTKLEKIIYVADMIEDGRSFPGVDELRKTADKDLDEAVKACTLATVRYNEKHGREIHSMAYKVLEWYENEAPEHMSENGNK